MLLWWVSFRLDLPVNRVDLLSLLVAGCGVVFVCIEWFVWCFDLVVACCVGFGFVMRV